MENEMRFDKREEQPGFERLGVLPPRSGARLNEREESLYGHFSDDGEMNISPARFAPPADV